MASIDDILLDESFDDVQVTLNDMLDEIKDMINSALTVATDSLVGASLLTLLSLSQEVTSCVIIDNSIPTVELTTPVKEVPPSLKIVAESEARIRLERDIKKIASLEYGWDGEAASKTSKLALHNVHILIQQLDDLFLEKCSVFPSNDAGVYLQGRLRNGKMTIFLNDNKMAYVIKNSDSRLSGTVEFNEDNVSYLNIGLRQYV